jgi:hypothetical protein
LYKFGWYDLSYKGSDEKVYQQLNYSLDQANRMLFLYRLFDVNVLLAISCIEQSEGDGNWETFVDLVYVSLFPL